MNTSGFANSRLKRLHQVLSTYVERGDLPGMVGLVSCHDHVQIETLGSLALGAAAPMRSDTIFRIASLTKPVTAVAAMILIEECRMRLDDSVEPWLPELANRRVMKSLAALDDTVPAKRAITVRDLLTYRMGFGSVMAMPDTYPIQKLVREYGIGGDGPPLPAQAPMTDEWLKRLASLPWMAHPGEKWLYHVSGEVLGILVSRISGMPLGEFFQERIFGPLGMKDTGFYVPKEKIRRLATSYQFNQQTKALEIYDDAKKSQWGVPPPLESGGGGLVGTVDDYFSFCRMMLNKGKHRNEQILSPASVQLMTSDQLTTENRAGSEIFFGDFSSWGLGMAVDTDRREIYHSPGRFGWTGGLGTTAYTDPANGVIGMLFTQRMMDSPEPPQFFTDFWTLAYAALES
jgi:CubicO group peptidase (beta-lactamase class C family)